MGRCSETPVNTTFPVRSAASGCEWKHTHTHTHVNQCYYPWLGCIWRCKCKHDRRPRKHTHTCTSPRTHIWKEAAIYHEFTLKVCFSGLLECINHQGWDDERVCFILKMVFKWDHSAFKAALGKNLKGKINPVCGNATERVQASPNTMRNSWFNLYSICSESFSSRLIWSYSSSDPAAPLHFFYFVKVAQRNPSLASKTTENTPLLKNASQLKCARLFSSSPHASDSSGGEPGVSSCQREARLSPPFRWKLVTEKLVGISPFSPSSSSSPFYHFMAPLPPPTGASSKCFKRWLFVTICTTLAVTSLHCCRQSW